MNIGDKQIQIINNAKLFLKSLESSNIDSSLSSFCYFTSWAETPGYARLKLQSEGWSFIFKFCSILLKNILSIASHAEYIEFSNKNLPTNYDIIVLTWSYKKNFMTDGSFQDRYFNENSKNLPNSYWILISMDDYIPSNLDNNIKIIRRKKTILKYDFFSLIRVIASIIITNKFSPRKIFNYLFFHSHFAKIITSIIKNELKQISCKAILLPYEAQPFQNSIFLEAKKINKKIITMGYLHSISPLTCELIYRGGAPDLLLVHGETQIEILKSKLNWPKDKLLLVQSFRYRLIEKETLSKKIFIPMSIHNYDKLLEEFKKLIIQSPKDNFPIFNIKIHPGTSNSKKHIHLKKELEKIMEIYKDRFSDNSPNKNTSLFFGVTSTILQSLEKQINVIHICSDPIFQSYSENIWPNLKVKQLSAFTFQYKLNSLGKHINFGKNNTLNQTLKAILN